MKLTLIHARAGELPGVTAAALEWKRRRGEGGYCHTTPNSSLRSLHIMVCRFLDSSDIAGSLALVSVELGVVGGGGGEETHVPARRCTFPHVTAPQTESDRLTFAAEPNTKTNSSLQRNRAGLYPLR